MVHAGQRVKFDPFNADRFHGISEMRRVEIGTVSEVHTEHKWFSVEYGNPKMRTSFNFADIGTTVFICK